MKQKYDIVLTNSFRRDYKNISKRGYNLTLLKEVVEILASGEPLPERHHDHALSGNFLGCRECHIRPDWLLIYQIEDEELILYLTRTGSHSNLF